MHAEFGLPDSAAAGVAKEAENTPLGWKRCDLTWSHAGRPARYCAKDDRLVEKRCGGGELRYTAGKAYRSIACSTLTVKQYYIMDIIRIDLEV